MLQILGWLAVVALVLLLSAILVMWVREFTAQPIRWPRSWVGWKRLFWIFVGRCPVDQGELLTDPWCGGDTLFCFKCGGVTMWPANIVIALQYNHRVHEKERGAAA